MKIKLDENLGQLGKSLLGADASPSSNWRAPKMSTSSRFARMKAACW